jgi:hypothetical protein
MSLQAPNPPMPPEPGSIDHLVEIDVIVEADNLEAAQEVAEILREQLADRPEVVSVSHRVTRRRYGSPIG